METLTIAIPSSVINRGVAIDLTAIHQDVLYQCLLLGLRTRTFDHLYSMSRNGRTETEWVTTAITAVFTAVRQEHPDDSDDMTCTIEIPRYVHDVAIYDVSEAVEPLDLAAVAPMTRWLLILGGILCFPIRDLPDRLLADELVLPGDETDYRI
jgi:hypothetical protein